MAISPFWSLFGHFCCDYGRKSKQDSNESFIFNTNCKKTANLTVLYQRKQQQNKELSISGCPNVIENFIISIKLPTGYSSKKRKVSR